MALCTSEVPLLDTLAHAAACATLVEDLLLLHDTTRGSTLRYDYGGGTGTGTASTCTDGPYSAEPMSQQQLLAMLDVLIGGRARAVGAGASPGGATLTAAARRRRQHVRLGPNGCWRSAACAKGNRHRGHCDRAAAPASGDSLIASDGGAALATRAAARPPRREG